MRLTPFLYSLCFAVAVGEGADDPANRLRLVGSAAGEEFDQVVVEEHELRIGAIGGATRAVPRGSRWRLEGDLLAHQSYFFLLPPFHLVTRPSVPLGDLPGARMHAIVTLWDRWPWEKVQTWSNTVAVVVWLVDGKAVRVLPFTARNRGDSSSSLIGVVAFEVGEAERTGRPAALLFQAGTWLPAERWFSNANVDAAFSQLHFGAGGDFAAALQGINPAKVRTWMNRSTLFHKVADGGFEAAIRWLLAQGVTPEMRDENDRTALHLAALDGHRGVVGALVAGGAHPFAFDAKRRSPFGGAVRNGHLETAYGFLGEEPPFEVLRDVFQLALEQYDRPTIENLLDRGKERLVRSMHAEDFRVCLAHGEATLIRRLLAMGMKADHEDLLLAAAFSGKGDALEALIENGARVARGADDGSTALLVAAARGQTECLDLLLDAGADVDRVNRLGESPLGLATEREHSEVMSRLRAGGARKSAVRKPGGRRPADLRWISDLLRAETGPVFGEDEVDLAPTVKEDVKPWVRRPVVGGLGTNSDVVWTGDPFTGEVSPRTVNNFGPFFASGGHWAVATMIVECGGSVSHARVVDANSREFWQAVDEVLEDYAFEPGILDGRPVRTRVTRTILVND